MDRSSRLAFALFFLGALVFSVPAQVSGFGGDGNITYSTDTPPLPPCEDPTVSDTVCKLSCFNEEDDEGDGYTDTDDIGCVLPSTGEVDKEVRDDTEAYIWDTDLTKTLRDMEGNSISRSVMFPGEVDRDGNVGGVTYNDYISVSTVYEYGINVSRSEGENWGFGANYAYSHQESDFPWGTAFESDHVVYPPSDLEGRGEADPESCGDGYQNQGDHLPPGPKGDEKGEDTVTWCTLDYGLIYEKYDVNTWYNDRGSTNFKCEDDKASCSGGSCGTCGSSCSSATCSIDEDNTDDTGNDVWHLNGDKLEEDECQVDSTDSVATDSCDTSSCCNCCDKYGNCISDDSCDWDVGEGNERSWSEISSIDCDADHSQVSGGSSSGSGDRNDEAATYTEFTAYADDSWDSGGGTNEDGKVWCGHEFTTTVDADGPRGYGNGFVVISTRGGGSIEGTWAHNGQDDVGKRVWVEVDGSGGSFFNAQDKIDKNCGPNRDVCLKYVDFWTESEDEDSWTTTSSGNGWKEAVRATTRVTMHPEDSYSVCKNINRIAGKQLVRCDYIKDSEPVSPLNASCGNKPRERMITAEGTEVDTDEMDEFLAYQQECVQYDQDPSSYSGSESTDVPAGVYCDGGPHSSASGADLGQDWISSVQFNEIDRNSKGDFDDGYQDFTKTWTPVRQGSVYELNVQVGMSDYYSQTVKVWFDWNGDGNFDSSQVVGTCNSPGCEVQTQVNVPAGANTGLTMMRVGERYGGEPPKCTSEDTSYEQGEVEDYTVRVLSSGRPEITENACILDGKVYPEGSVKNVANNKESRFHDFEAGGDSNDKEVCVDINDIEPNALEADEWLPGNLASNLGDRGGEWRDIDNWAVTQYLRNNVVDSKEYLEYWENNPDKKAKNITGVKHKYKRPGMALEDDCAATINNPSVTCEDQGAGTGRQTPVFAKFYEGARDDDYFDGKTWLDVNLDSFHNRVQSGGNTGHSQDYATRKQEMVDYEYQWDQGTFSDTESNDTFMRSTEQRTIFVNWDEGEPNNAGGEDCAEANWDGGQWNDISCTDSHQGLCEVDGGYSTTTSTSWGDARSICQSRGGDLAVVNNQDENEYIQNNYGNVWLGYYQPEGSAEPAGGWQWVNDAGADVNGEMMGKQIFGSYTSRVFDKTPEKYFTNITAFHNYSGGDHPLVVEMAEDEDFTENVRTEGFWMNSSQGAQTYQLSGSAEQQYLRFRIGISTAPKPAQVAFVFDETGSMGSIQDEVQKESKEFMNQLGPNSEGAVIGYREDYNGNDKVYQTFTDDKGSVEDAIDDLAANGGEEATGKGIGSAMNELSWDPTASKAIIHVQDGNGCDCPKDPQDYEGDMIDQQITFYNVETGSEWGTELNNMAQNTDGRHWETPGNWSAILDEISTDLQVIPKNAAVDKVRVTARTPPSAGTGNTQDDEPEILSQENHPEYLNWSENSNIDPEDDEWAYTPTLEWAIANNGTAWPPGACYGSPREQGVDKWKNQSTYANSYAKATHDHWGGGYSAGQVDGSWIDPDNTSLSVTEGELSCDLTGHDWGYAVQNASANGINPQLGSDFDETSDPGSAGIENNLDQEIPMALNIEKSEFAWDMDYHHPRDPKENLSQWKGACGDDRNEYLIREHAAKMGGEYNPTFAGRSDFFACADRPTDCVLDGQVYSEGMIVDVSSVANNEHGDNSRDQEICLDINDELPGGEWWDVDNESLRRHLIGTGTELNPELFVRNGPIDPFSPGEIFWHNGTREGANEVNRTPYNPIGVSTPSYFTGYALEDDCDPDLTPVVGCDDTGGIENNGYMTEPRRNHPGLKYSPFRESMGGNQIVFAVDETYSMGPVIEGVKNNIKWFYEQFQNAEGTVVGSGCDAGSDPYGHSHHCLNGSYPGDQSGSSEPRDTTPGEGLTFDLDELKQGAENLRERTSSEAPDDTISEAVGYGTEASDYPSGDMMYEDENYNFDDGVPKAVIWVEDGRARGSCSGVSSTSEGSLGDYLIDNNFQFYAIVRDLSGCRDNFETAADNTGGKVYDLSSNPDSSEWQNILADIRSNMDTGNIEIKSDDYSIATTWSVKMYVNGSHSDGRGLSDHANNGQMYENTDDIDWDTSHVTVNGLTESQMTHDLNDSKIDPGEDTWAIASEPWDAVGPTGAVYDVGKCYGSNPPDYAEGWIEKNETVMANSYAMRREANSDGGDEGDWVDPDITFRSVSNGSLSCDLNSTDWGIGFNTGVGTNLQVVNGDARDYGYEISDEHAVLGPITFDWTSDPLEGNQNNLQQYPDACGDDKNEYLIREQVSHRGDEHRPNLTHKDNIYVCADRITDCAYNGMVFSEGQTADLSALSPGNTDPELGDNISDREICLDLNKTTPGGEWYDKDQNFTVKNKIYGLDDTFQMTENSSANRCEYDISGRVKGVDTQYGNIEIDGETRTVDSSGRFSYTNLELGCGTKKALNYRDVGYVQAQKKLILPENDADLDNLVISKELIYQPIEVWNGIENFRDNYYDVNPGSDWKTPTERLEREETSYFNRTHTGQNRTQPETLTSSIELWDSGEPNDFLSPPGEHCAEANWDGDEWNDIWCDKKQRALCEYPGYRNYEVTTPKKWDVAKELCEARGGHLAVIETVNENDYIANNFGPGDILIGYRQPDEPGANLDPDEGWEWVNGSGTYRPEGYATEDDCGPRMRNSILSTGPCGDVGPGVQDKPWFSASNFSYGGVSP